MNITGTATAEDGTKYNVALTPSTAPTPTPTPVPTPTPTPHPSAEGTFVAAPSTAAIIADDGTSWTIAGGQVQIGGKPDAATSGVTGILKHSGMWQVNSKVQWYVHAAPGASWPWNGPFPDPRVLPSPSPAPAAGALSVTAAGGFKMGSTSWTMRGLNGGVQDCLHMLGNLFTQLPGITCVRLNTGGNDNPSQIDQVVKTITGRGCVVEIEDHSGNPNNVAWYTQMATAYKGNPLVILEMPNEPNPSNLTAIQIGLVKAIRGAGFTNPVALQPAGGYDFGQIGATLNGIPDKTNIFITPHIYYSGNDPNGASQYVNNDITACRNFGCFPAIDEFGEAMDGWNWDQFGASVVSSTIAANKAGSCGALYWAMNNGLHSNGADSAFIAADASQLSPTGTGLKTNWLG